MTETTPPIRQWESSLSEGIYCGFLPRFVKRSGAFAEGCLDVPDESGTSRHPASFPSMLTVWPGHPRIAVTNDTVPYRVVLR